MYVFDIIYMVMVIHEFLLSMLRFERPDILASPRPFVVLRASFGNRHETAISLSPGGGEVGKHIQMATLVMVMMRMITLENSPERTPRIRFMTKNDPRMTMEMK